MMIVSVELIKAKCTCAYCEKTISVVIETKVFVVDNRVNHYISPKGIRCLTCHLPYLKWEQAEIIKQ